MKLFNVPEMTSKNEPFNQVIKQLHLISLFLKHFSISTYELILCFHHNFNKGTTNSQLEDL